MVRKFFETPGTGYSPKFRKLKIDEEGNTLPFKDIQEYRFWLNSFRYVPLDRKMSGRERSTQHDKDGPLRGKASGDAGYVQYKGGHQPFLLLVA